MHAPGWVCRALYRIHPQLRIAWAGRERRYEDELNPGCFAIVQLYHISDFGRPDKPHTFREGWELTVKPKEYGEVEFEQIYRGPIFNRWGGGAIDYDPLFRVPVFVATIDECYSHKDGRPMDTADVFNGSFLDTIEWWLIPIKRRISEQYREMGKDLDRRADDISRDAADFLWHEANKPDADYSPVPWKYAKHHIGTLDKLEERTENLQNYYTKNIEGSLKQ